MFFIMIQVSDVTDTHNRVCVEWKEVSYKETKAAAEVEVALWSARGWDAKWKEIK